MKPNPHPVQASVRKRFFDFFERNSTNDDLGIAPDGSRWNSLRGIFTVFLGRATSDDSPSSYPIASIDFPFEDVDIDVDDINNGSGVALWITDSGNWWGIGLEQAEVECNCDVGTECNRWNQAGLCTTWNQRNCIRWNSRNCRRWNAEQWTTETNYVCARWNKYCPSQYISGPFCTRWFRECTQYRAVTNSVKTANSNCRNYNDKNCRDYNAQTCTTWSVANCNRWNEFTFNCETCYPQWIRLIQSVNSTVSTITRFFITKTFRTEQSPLGGLELYKQDTFTDKIVRSMKIFLRGEQLSADLYHEVNFQDKVDVQDEVTYSATGAAIEPSYGIMVNPSEYNQNNFIGSIEIKQAD